MPQKKSTAKSNIVYHKDGSIWAKGKMVNGVSDGYWKWFRKPTKTGGAIGMIMRSGHFKKGKQVGEWITYDKAGKIYKVTTIKITK
ncbi:MAG: hypothetical protein V4467_00980 [Patescibacteria group bacterium]